MLTKKLFSRLFPHADESLRLHDHQTPGLWIYNLLRKQHRFQLSLRKRKNAFGKLRGCQRNRRVRRTPAMTKKRHAHAVFCHIFFSSKDFNKVQKQIGLCKPRVPLPTEGIIDRIRESENQTKNEREEHHHEQL